MFSYESGSSANVQNFRVFWQIQIGQIIGRPFSPTISGGPEKEKQKGGKEEKDKTNKNSDQNRAKIGLNKANTLQSRAIVKTIRPRD